MWTMLEVKIVESVKVPCPLLKRDIAEGYCYDINAFLNRWVTNAVLDDADVGVIDRDKSCAVCDACSFNVFE